MSYRDYPPPQPSHPPPYPSEAPRSQNPYDVYAQTPPYRLSREELQVIKECNRESFYGRCLPMMTALGLGVYYGVQSGHLKPNPKYGALPKVMLGVIVGFIGGKVSYKSKCEEKVLALPGGKLKESILQRRSQTISNFQDGVFNDMSMSYTMPYVSNNLLGEAKSISELDTERPMESFDSSFRSPYGFDENENESEILPIAPTHSVTYDELRQRNREAYENSRKMYRSGPLDDYSPHSGTYIPPAAPTAPPQNTYKPAPVQPVQEPLEPYSAPQPRPTPLKKNLYGDVYEK